MQERRGGELKSATRMVHGLNAKYDSQISVPPFNPTWSRRDLFANAHEQAFHIYRVFEFRRAPKLFELGGRPDRHCRLDATTYRASFA